MRIFVQKKEIMCASTLRERCPDTYMNYEESLKDYRDMCSVMKNPSCAALSYLQCLALEIALEIAWRSLGLNIELV